MAEKVYQKPHLTVLIFKRIVKVENLHRTLGCIEHSDLFCNSGQEKKKLQPYECTFKNGNIFPLLSRRKRKKSYLLLQFAANPILTVTDVSSGWLHSGSRPD